MGWLLLLLFLSDSRAGGRRKRFETPKKQKSTVDVILVLVWNVLSYTFPQSVYYLFLFRSYLRPHNLSISFCSLSPCIISPSYSYSFLNFSLIFLQLHGERGARRRNSWGGKEEKSKERLRRAERGDESRGLKLENWSFSLGLLFFWQQAVQNINWYICYPILAMTLRGTRDPRSHRDGCREGRADRIKLTWNMLNYRFHESNVHKFVHLHQLRFRWLQFDISKIHLLNGNTLISEKSFGVDDEAYLFFYFFKFLPYWNWFALQNCSGNTTKKMTGNGRRMMERHFLKWPITQTNVSTCDFSCFYYFKDLKICKLSFWQVFHGRV